ncbi:DUF257 family protein [Thermococcus sp.]|uniref:DUF257 family protein n=1 Tax=Thermococcus sp. TaxID=35749 RepID=UPI002612494C|nr:DUF257 family protein [Thermococcus sp.]
MGLMEAALIKIWEEIKPGETVIFERTGEGDVTLGLYRTLTWAQEMGFQVAIIDVLDTYATLATKALLSGFEGELFQGVNVIKIGGIKQVGRVVSHITEISEPTILTKKFKEAYEPILENAESTTLAIAVGLEKLFLVSDMSPRGIQIIVNHLSEYVGRPERLGIYIIKRDILSGTKEFALKLLEDIATTVIRTEKKGRMTEFHIVKSLNKELEGVLVRV